jgi:hypothetical protein
MLCYNLVDPTRKPPKPAIPPCTHLCQHAIAVYAQSKPHSVLNGIVVDGLATE